MHASGRSALFDGEPQKTTWNKVTNVTPAEQTWVDWGINDIPSVAESIIALEERVEPATVAVRGPIGVQEAREWFWKTSEDNMRQLCDQTLVQFQNPIMALLHFVGEEEPSWEACRSHLGRGREFLLQVVAREEPISSTTVGFMEMCNVPVNRIEEHVKSMRYHGGTYTAFAAAVLVEAMVRTARERLGLHAGLVPAPSALQWTLARPRMADFDNLGEALAQVADLLRPALIVCGDKEDGVIQYLMYQLATIVQTTDDAPTDIAKLQTALADEQDAIVVKLGSKLDRELASSLLEHLQSQQVRKGAVKRGDTFVKLPRLIVTTKWNIVRAAHVLPALLPCQYMAVVRLSEESLAGLFPRE
jgi:hypothetical protein